MNDCLPDWESSKAARVAFTSDGRYLGVTVYRDCLRFKMMSGSLDGDRSVVYRLAEDEQDRRTDYTFFTKPTITQVVPWDGPWVWVTHD